MQARFELGVRAVMVALNSRLLERLVHPLDLTISPRMVGLGQPVFDTIRITKHVKHIDAPPCRRPETVLRQVRKLNAVIGKHRVDL